MDKELELPSWVYRLQSRLIGQRFAGASLHNARTTPEDTQRISDWMKKKTGFLVMMGKPGCGKTYICSALLSWMYGKVSDMYYFREGKFFEKIRESMDNKGDWNQEVSYQCDHEFLVFDDIGSAGHGQTGWRQDVFFEIVNLRYQSKNPTVFSTNYSEQEIKEKLGARTHSRLFSNENTIIDMFDYPDLRISM